VTTPCASTKVPAELVAPATFDAYLKEHQVAAVLELQTEPIPPRLIGPQLIARSLVVEPTRPETEISSFQIRRTPSVESRVNE
jgi:hypothetical protein